MIWKEEGLMALPEEEKEVEQKGQKEMKEQGNWVFVFVFERDKNFGDLFLVKLKTAITFAPIIRITIIISAFWVEENFPCRGN